MARRRRITKTSHKQTYETARPSSRSEKYCFNLKTSTVTYVAFPSSWNSGVKSATTRVKGLHAPCRTFVRSIIGGIPTTRPNSPAYLKLLNLFSGSKKLSGQYLNIYLLVDCCCSSLISEGIFNLVPPSFFIKIIILNYFTCTTLHIF